MQGGQFFISELHPYKQYTVSKAHFCTDNEVIKELEVYLHHLSDYLRSAGTNGFGINMIEEWFDNHCKKPIPRLITFLFKKPD